MHSRSVERARRVLRLSGLICACAPPACMPHCLLDGMEGAAHFSAELHGIELSVGRLGKDGAGAAIPIAVVMRRVGLFVWALAWRATACIPSCALIQSAVPAMLRSDNPRGSNGKAATEACGMRPLA